MSLPEPLTPADCDCRGLPFMPLEVTRLMESDFTALSTGDEFKAGLILWAKSWSQVPAASLPSDDRILAHLVGRSLADWLTVKEMALHNWILCSDGRLYHPVIADLAAAAVEKRKGQADRANSRWAKVRAAKAAASASEKPRQEKPDAPAQGRDAAACAPAMQGTVEEEGKNPPVVPPGDEAVEVAIVTPDTVREAFDLWNRTAERCDLPKAKDLTEPRRRALRKRLDEHGPEGWRAAVAAVEVSAFCRGMRQGRDGRAFRADFDFLLQPKSFQRLREGYYGDDAPPPAEPRATTAPPPADPAAGWRRRLQTFRQNQHWDRIEWGPQPGRPDCQVPAEILTEFGYSPRSAA